MQTATDRELIQRHFALMMRPDLATRAIAANMTFQDVVLRSNLAREAVPYHDAPKPTAASVLWDRVVARINAETAARNPGVELASG
jgi:hypothetical protein